MRKLFSAVLCLCLCVCLVSCATTENYTGASDDYDEGLAQGKEDFFLTLWKSAYDMNGRKFGELWETDDFSIMIAAKRKTEVQSDLNAPYIEIDFTLKRGELELQWKTGSLRFYMYSVTESAKRREVGNSDWFYDYFDIGGTIDGNKAYTDILPIDEDANVLLVVIVVDDHIYSTSYDVNI